MSDRRKRTSAAVHKDIDDASEPVAKRRSSRQAAAAASKKPGDDIRREPEKAAETKKRRQSGTSEKTAVSRDKVKPQGKDASVSSDHKRPSSTTQKPKANGKAKPDKSKSKATQMKSPAAPDAKEAEDSGSESEDVDAIPAMNPEAPRHDEEWYWLMKAEPESRFENGIDVRFSIDDLRAKTKPEGWDGIRAYAARNHMRNMNAGDKAFFYHSNCKEPGIVGVMEIVKEFSEDKSARRPGTPYYDPASTKEAPRWSLVHVEFRRKFAVPIFLRELRDLGKAGGPLENMQMLKQSRLSVSRVSTDEWAALCRIADEKAAEAGLQHEDVKV